MSSLRPSSSVFCFFNFVFRVWYFPFFHLLFPCLLGPRKKNRANLANCVYYLTLSIIVYFTRWIKIIIRDAKYLLYISNSIRGVADKNDIISCISVHFIRSHIHLLSYHVEIKSCTTRSQGSKKTVFCFFFPDDYLHSL